MVETFLQVILDAILEVTNRLEITCKMPFTLANYRLQPGWDKNGLQISFANLK